MGKKNKKNNNLPLTDEEKDYFRKEIGEIDYSQDFLELFTPSVITDIKRIMVSCSDNQMKADIIDDELNYLGFKELGLGTNLLTMINKKYPGVVFKIALDPNGIDDNRIDNYYQDVIPKYTKVLALHHTGLISVQERFLVIKRASRMQMYHKTILSLLKKLSKIYLIADLSPASFMNYALDHQGHIRIIDGSDLIELTEVQSLKCKNLMRGKNDKIHKCGGELQYDELYQYLVCKECGVKINPLELRKEIKEVNFMKEKFYNDGVSTAERKQLCDLANRKKEYLSEQDDRPDQRKTNDCHVNYHRTVVSDPVKDPIVSVEKTSTVVESPSTLKTVDKLMLSITKPENTNSEVDYDDEADGEDDGAILGKIGSVDSTSNGCYIINGNKNYATDGDELVEIEVVADPLSINIALAETEKSVDEILEETGISILVSLNGGDDYDTLFTAEDIAREIKSKLLRS